MEIDNEIGKTFETLLKRFRRGNICVQDLFEESLDKTQDTLFVLIQRNFIACDGKEYQSPRQIDISDTFRITMEGINYLELRERFLNRYWVRSILVPIIVSITTTIITALITLYINGIAIKLTWL